MFMRIMLVLCLLSQFKRKGAGAREGTRTLTLVTATDFKSAMSTIPSL